MFNLIIFGPPGSGKGTQSIKIAEKYRLIHISTGDIFRNEIRNKTEIGLKVKSITEKGELVPDELLIEILKSVMDKHKETKGFVFDGFPRTIVQAEDLDNLMKEEKSSISLVIALEVHEEELIARLLNRAIETGRKDDTEEVIQNRLKVYNKQTKPLIDFYKKQNKFELVHGVGSIDDIFNELCEVIDSIDITKVYE